jgi:flavin reductase (DIM6/NTAB) family NADH-FMN oxidoreductase RutF
MASASEQGGGLNPKALRTAFAAFPSGVTSVAAICNDVPTGLVASSFTSVSLEPALVSVCIARTSTTWPQLRRRPRLGLSVLAQSHGDVARALAARGIDRFREVSWENTQDGAVFVHGSTLWLDCSLYREIPAGDHEIVLLLIHRFWRHLGVAPLVFHRSTFWQLREGAEISGGRV